MKRGKQKEKHSDRDSVTAFWKQTHLKFLRTKRHQETKFKRATAQKQKSVLYLSFLTFESNESNWYLPLESGAPVQNLTTQIVNRDGFGEEKLWSACRRRNIKKEMEWNKIYQLHHPPGPLKFKLCRKDKYVFKCLPVIMRCFCYFWAIYYYYGIIHPPFRLRSKCSFDHLWNILN